MASIAEMDVKDQAMAYRRVYELLVGKQESGGQSLACLHLFHTPHISGCHVIICVAG